jgi:hypothetical protein
MSIGRVSKVNLSSAVLSSKNPTWTYQEVNMGCSSEKLAASDLSYGMA